MAVAEGTAWVGGGSGVAVAKAIPVKTAVWVRFGVGNVNGVGEAMPGKVQLVSATARRRIISLEILDAISTSIPSGPTECTDCTM
jgi:hypothetical protein